MNKWDKKFLGLAKHISTWSKDPRRKVGAVVVHPKSRQVVGMGFNGPPKGVDDLVIFSEEKNAHIVHAEINAILQAKNCEGKRLYIYPCLPCASCAGAIINAGITEVHVASTVEKIKWNHPITINMFKQVGIKVCGHPQE